MTSQGQKASHRNKKKRTVKCVVWDLDNTLWEGVLLEDQEVTLKNDAVAVIETLDHRGILQSIASKNDHDDAMGVLKRYKLDEYFLYPQIGWNSKANAITAVAKAINIGLDAMAFVDDDPFEREEVNYSLDDVLCIDASELARIPHMPEMQPRFITDDSKVRRQMYLNDMKRNEAEDVFIGPHEDFLASLNMELKLFCPQENDMARAEELTIRTNQLNTTGYTYSYDELNEFRESKKHQLLMAQLNDKYGSYGHIGLALVETGLDAWTIKLLLMSCRVMSRGVGTIMLNHIMGCAKDQGVRLLAEFVPNGRNRMMNITYRLSGFREIGQQGKVTLLENDLNTIQPFPDYVRVQKDEILPRNAV